MTWNEAHKKYKRDSLRSSNFPTNSQEMFATRTLNFLENGNNKKQNQFMDDRLFSKENTLIMGNCM